ncbi:hypothetical protein E2C01_001680 [Portunus trituberculatus]|uniref:Uncharacterized protein n=1 Tax=Portunus trituberculatus TaxID=210409 RepID=A0A5B7CIN7_PORTR|nr:hypothetical protein [Portunus trituberculatus]
MCQDKKAWKTRDFNDDMLIKGSNISKIVRDNKLTQIIEKPTRKTPHSVTLLDLIITNKPEVPQVIADYDLVSVVIDICAPVVTKAVKGTPAPWLRAAMENRNALRKSTFARTQEKLRNEEITVNRPDVNATKVNSAFRPEAVDSVTLILIVKDLNATNSIGSDDWFLTLRSRQAITSSVTRQRNNLHVQRTNTLSGDKHTDSVTPKHKDHKVLVLTSSQYFMLTMPQRKHQEPSNCLRVTLQSAVL